MPAYDTFHDAVKRALIKDGWTITDDPYTITYGGTALYVDMPAKQPIAADRGDHLIAVEVEHFNGVSLLSDYHTALGRYVCHRLAMRTADPRRVLFLALPRNAYEELFAVWFTRQSLREYRIPLIAYDPEEEVQLRWITKFAPESWPSRSSSNSDPRHSDPDSLRSS